MMYIYYNINRHAGTPDKNRNKNIVPVMVQFLKIVLIRSNNIAVDLDAIKVKGL